MPKDIKTLGNNKARACESLGFVHKKRLCQRFDTTSFCYNQVFFYLLCSCSFMAAAALRPSPIARITVAPPRTMSPPA